jgi:hypothetical protein
LGEPSCHIVQQEPKDARVSLERRRENHDRAIDDIGEVGKNIKVSGKLVYNPGCLTLICPLRYVVWPDKFRQYVTTHYDDSSNPIKFLQLYIVAVKATHWD